MTWTSLGQVLVLDFAQYKQLFREMYKRKKNNQKFDLKSYDIASVII